MQIVGSATKIKLVWYNVSNYLQNVTFTSYKIGTS